MNCEYDTDKAKDVLSAIRQDEYKATEGIASTGIVGLERTKLDKLRVVDLQYPPSTRLLEEDDDSEAVFKMQGVICGKMLPPVLALPYGTNTPSKIRNLRQHVKITGFGSKEFEGYVDKLQDIHDKFSGQVADRTIDPFDFLPYEGNAALDSHSRYFTDRHLIPYEKSHRFLPGVDPHRILRTIQPDDFVHGPDNVVEYCARTADSNGRISYSPCEPSVFKVGDLVEVAFSCVGVPIKGQRMRILLQLRGVTLLDNIVRKESERLDKLSISNAVVHRTPKRKTLYLSHYDEIRGSGTVKRQRSDDDMLQARLFVTGHEGTRPEEGEIADNSLVHAEDGENNYGATQVVPVTAGGGLGAPTIEDAGPAEDASEVLDSVGEDGFTENGDDGMTEYGEIEDEGIDELAEGESAAEGAGVSGEGGKGEAGDGDAPFTHTDDLDLVEFGVEAMNVD
ncbi:hypothetical protein DFP72DRAFT_965302 [Ephemerocybe angulata]|uniref:Uncharacterized protein n=1 Tax=Ephemerocybe angulata TaxID=980116 RepID=A0A8H6M460_9AGAR|nr:hypothetical protein DFP72DRAFT_965302 [Tulosesus angulatus]